MDVEAFIARWTAREGGAERANYQMFLSELCDAIDVARPDPAGHERGRNDYAFERAVTPRDSEGQGAPRRIDLYRKNAFILEAKQSRLPGMKNALPGRAPATNEDAGTLGRRGAARGWDVMMQNARKQAEHYVSLLDAQHPAPPFLIVCDVGHCLELYADFSGNGRRYAQFPDRRSFRIYMEDLRDETIRERLRQVWLAPHALDPTKVRAHVTRGIARRLAEVGKAMEKQGRDAEAVADFLMRCVFTMFADDVGLLTSGTFKALLEKSIADPRKFVPLLTSLWRDMAAGSAFSPVVEGPVPRFNGGLFEDTTVFPLGREEIGELLEAAKHDWNDVEPAIFGTLLEQALDKAQRRMLGAHYTPSAYVARLVEATVMEPLRADWEAVLKKAQQAAEEGFRGRAIATIKDFHRRLCSTRVLDPACGTGNFLYVTLWQMKDLEGELLETLAKLGETEAMALDRESIDPHQFLGLEINPRAAAIAELVVWIGYLQWHFRIRTGRPAEPILRAFGNINFGRRQSYDAVLTWDGYPETKRVPAGGRSLEAYPNPRRPAWPEAEFIVGNPPYVGGKDLRSRMPDGYAEALWKAHPQMNDSADYVMYWWDRAAELLTRPTQTAEIGVMQVGDLLATCPPRRMGFVTTNSIGQVFQRRVVERRLRSQRPISIAFAIPDYPWTKATPGAAAVRIAMTVAEAGIREGVLCEVISEVGLETDRATIAVAGRVGPINADLTIGADVTAACALLANDGLSSPGVKLHGAGFVISRARAEYLGLSTSSGLSALIRPYRNGRDLTGRARDMMVIDLFGLSAQQVRRDYPEVYQHILGAVKPERDLNNRTAYRENWWIFGEPRSALRLALDGLPRYIATVETAKHRAFQFLDAAILPDNMIVAIASDDAAHLAILSSRVHVGWALATGGTLEDRPRYSKSRSFDPFPFPDLAAALRQKLRAAGEELDALRKRVIAAHPDLTLTGLYNVLEKLRAGAQLSAKDEDVKARGLVLLVKELHEAIDRLVAEAYGWPADLSDDDILAHCVALNAERAREEAAGRVRWLRPDYQIPRFAKGSSEPAPRFEFGPTVVAIGGVSPAFPSHRDEQPLAVEAMLIAAGRPMSAAEVARAFRRGGRRIEPRVDAVLTTLARYGWIGALPDGRYAARRAA